MQHHRRHNDHPYAAFAACTLLIAFLLIIAVLTSGCAANRVTPKTPVETAIEGYGTIEKANRLTPILLRSNLISLDQARNVRDESRRLRYTLDEAMQLYNAGDMTSTVGQLETTKKLVDDLNAFLAENASKVPPPPITGSAYIVDKGDHK